MKAPDKIYMPNELLSEEWQRHIEGEDTEYIRKDLLFEWAKELTSEPYNRTTESARKIQIAHYLLEKYDSL